MNYGPASKYYDLFASNEDIDFYKKMALERGKKALELGVGTGRVAIELARAGIFVLGIDNSKYMLKVARQKLRNEKASVRRRVRVRFGDMRDFRSKETFPFVYMASSTFEHCVTEEDQKRCLNSVYNVLERKGVLTFDMSQLVPGKPETSWWIDRKTLNAEKEVVRTIFSRRNPQTNIVGVNLFFDVYYKGKLDGRYYEYGEAKISSKDEVEKLLKNAGFRIGEIYSNFDKSALSPGSQRIVFVASTK